MKGDKYGSIRGGLMVKRFHTVGYVATPETVGHHTANVIAILFYLYDEAPPLSVIRAALHHDVAEAVLGDLPAPAKWAYPKLAKAYKDAEAQVEKELELEQTTSLEALDNVLLKYADMMDLVFKAIEEVAVGNKMFLTVLTNGLNYCSAILADTLKTHKLARELFEYAISCPFVDIQEMVNGPEPVKH